MKRRHRYDVVEGSARGRPRGLRILALFALLAGCAGRTPPPAVSPVDEEAEAAAIAAALAAGVDAADVEEAAEEADDAVETLDAAAQREFLALFGTDPLGLANRPVNAAVYEIPLEMNDKVQRWIDYFTTGDGRERFGLYLQRAGRYEEMIRARARAAGQPEDLLYIAMIESGMNPNAYSRARAVGMWQFMPATGRAYGLEIDFWLDERRDPFLATDAAIAHLGDLHDRFGSWYLAAAAYNAGPGRVSRGIRSTGSDDFWDLADAKVLRAETRNYVPKLLAAATIARNREDYGFEDIEPFPALEFDEVEVPDATSFDVLAEAAGVSESDIKDLNPQFIRQVTPPKQAVTLRLPVGTAEVFAANYAQVPADQRVTWLEHRVTRGQTLGAIANRYGTSVAAIQAANNNVSPRRLQVGQRLVIPRSRGARLASTSSSPGATGSVSAARVAASLDGPLTVTVQRGDTLWAIARRYGTSTGELMASNNLSSAVIHPGDRITVRR